MSSFRRRLMMAQGGGGGNRTPENAEEGVYVYSTDGYLYTKDEVEEVNAIDITAGYPDKLNFE